MRPPYDPRVNPIQKLIPCVCQQERREELIQKELLALSGLQGRLRGWTIEQWWDKYDKEPGRKEAATKMQDIIIENKGGWITLIGEAGTGKSYLLAAVVNLALSEKKQGLYITWANLMEHYRRVAVHEVPETRDNFHKRICEVPVLAVDEYMRQRETGFALEIEHRVFEQRYIHSDTRATIIASNIDIKKWPDWLSSRAKEFAVVRLQGRDLRKAAGE